MPSKEYYEGRDMENNLSLQNQLKNIFLFDDVFSDGSNSTKTDIYGVKGNEKFSVSVKNVSGPNTQVHLTTLKKLSKALSIPETVATKLKYWLGDEDEFDSWLKEGLSSYEKNHKRISSHNIEEWSTVENWFNANKTNISRLLIEGDKIDKTKYLIWSNKKTKKFEVIDVSKLIEFIDNECVWITQPNGTVLRCVNQNNKPIFHLQMKGNRQNGGYNHTPQFHIHSYWPKDIILSDGFI